MKVQSFDRTRAVQTNSQLSEKLHLAMSCQLSNAKNLPAFEALVGASLEDPGTRARNARPVLSALGLSG